MDHGQRGDVPDATGAAPISANDPAVVQLFGAAHAGARTFADMLADDGVTRGLIGPREVPRLWERHLLNSASVAPFLPGMGTVVDVGSGAGLPGVVLALLRPDLHTVLLEPMERRAQWLREVVDALGLTSVEVVRGRAEDAAAAVIGDAVTARAVAPMERLARWSLPLLRQDGVLLAMKGRNAAAELDDARTTITDLGGADAEILVAPTIPGVESTTVVRVRKLTDAQPARRAAVGSPSTRRGAARQPRAARRRRSDQ